MCHFGLDGVLYGAIRMGWDEDDPEGSLAELADRRCETFLHEEIWGGSPMCREHPTRPMWATTDDEGVAGWACEAGPERDRIRIGELGLPG